jgi:hypothetical protein
MVRHIESLAVAVAGMEEVPEVEPLEVVVVDMSTLQPLL